LHAQLGTRRLRFNDDQRRRLAVRAKLLGRKVLTEVATIVTQEVGIQSVKLPPRSPNLNAYAERFVRTIKDSRLDRLILFGEGSLRKAIREFVVHYHLERNHQGLGNQLIIPQTILAKSHGAIQRRQRLGGMLNYYHRAA
jgi:putative transposase